MSKGLILKIILGGFFVFLLLPAFYDEEKPAKGNSFKDAYAFNPDGYDGEELPVVEQEPSSGENIFKRYGKRFKQMYGRAFLGAPTEREEAPRVYAGADNAEDDDLYYAMAMLFGGDEGSALRSSYEKGKDGNINALPSGSYNGGSSSLKQTVHNNAPVKGLYESSSVESYENRSRAKQVYSNVMKKIDRNAPSRKAASAGGGNSAADDGQNMSSSESGRLEAFRNGVPGMVSTPSWAADISDSFLNGAKFNRVYTGIASRSSNKGGYNSARANSGGTYGGFSNSRAEFTDEDRNAQDLGELFIQASSDINAKVKDISQAIRDKAASGTGDSSSVVPGPDIQRPDGNGGSSQGSGGGNTGGNDGGNGQGAGEGGSEGISGDNSGGVNNPDTPSAEDSKFDISKWDTDMNRSCRNPDAPDAPSVIGSSKWGQNFGSFSGGQEDDQDKIQVESCSGDPVHVDNVPALNGEISSKQVLVDLGEVEVEGQLLRATPVEGSVAAAGIKAIGFKNYISGTQKIPSSEGAFNGIDKEGFIINAKNPNTIILTTSQKIAEAYIGRAVLINPGDLEKQSAVRQIAERLNNMDRETQNILAAKAAREAAAR